MSPKESIPLTPPDFFVLTSARFTSMAQVICQSKYSSVKMSFTNDVPFVSWLTPCCEAHVGFFTGGPILYCRRCSTIIKDVTNTSDYLSKGPALLERWLPTLPALERQWEALTWHEELHNLSLWVQKPMREFLNS